MSTVQFSQFEMMFATVPELDPARMSPGLVADYLEAQAPKYFHDLSDRFGLNGEQYYPDKLVQVAAYCCALGLDSWDAIQNRLEWDAELRRLAGEAMVNLRLMKRCVAHYRELLKHLVAGALEQGWRIEMEGETCFTVRRHNRLGSWPGEFKRSVRSHFGANAAVRLNNFTLALHREI